MKSRYSMLIQWSDEDRVYVVSLPEFGPYAKTHGSTYAAAVKHGQEALELLISSSETDGRPLPKPWILDHPPDVCELVEIHQRSDSSAVTRKRSDAGLRRVTREHKQKIASSEN